MFSSSHNKRKRQNIDQLLRSDLVFKRSAQKTGADQIEAAVKLATNHLTGRRIVFTESCEYLKVHELVDLSRYGQSLPISRRKGFCRFSATQSP